MIDILVKGNVQVSGLSPVDLAQVQKSLTIPNPLHAKLVRMKNTAALYACPKVFTFYTIHNETLCIPRGMRRRLIHYLNKRNLPFKLSNHTVNAPVQHITNATVKLRSHQEKAATEAIQHPEGMVVASMGSGKTIIGLEIAKRLQQKTLIIVDRKHLGSQWIQECEKFYNYTPGQVFADKNKPKEITVTTWQSLAKIIHQARQDTGLVLVDECQGVVSDKRTALLERLKPKYLYGLTATPERSKDDGRTEAIEFYIGPTLYTHRQENVIPTVEIIRTGIKSNNFEYQRLEDEMTTHTKRNNLIQGLAACEIMAGKKVLVLTKRVAHYKEIHSIMPKFHGLHCIDAKDKDTASLIASLKAGEDFNGLFGTFSLLGTGLDIKSLDVLILASSIKSNVLTAQACGRILRLFGDKKPKIYDLVDYDIPIYKRHYWERKKVYDERGWEVN